MTLDVSEQGVEHKGRRILLLKIQDVSQSCPTHQALYLAGPKMFCFPHIILRARCVSASAVGSRASLIEKVNSFPIV